MNDCRQSDLDNEDARRAVDASSELKAIGLLIKRGRKEAFNESRELFSRRLGCSPLTLDKIEDGAEGVGFGLVMAALKVLGAASATLDAVTRSIDLLQMAQHPVSFPVRGFRNKG